ncbi:MAG TPA: DUF6152 family protein [Gammaproteobacteria bacterium]|nr:DUF6152 family protein [Gammaproteobacteria bacterium]
MKRRKLGSMRSAAVAAILGGGLCGVAPLVQAHHSYAMFNMSKAAVVQGTVARLEWVNPHVFVWLYVERPHEPGKYDLYAFESGPINLMTRYGWTKNTLAVGEKISVYYFPLKDGRTGGSFIKAIHADGRETLGDPFQPGVLSAGKNVVATEGHPDPAAPDARGGPSPPEQ